MPAPDASRSLARVKHGRLFLAAIGVALLVVGVVAVFLSTPAAVIALVLVIGLAAIVLAVSDWTEFEAEARDVKFKISKPGPISAPPERTPEIKILSLEERGGSSGFVDFAAEVVNEGTRRCRVEISAFVDETPVRCDPTTLDLLINHPAERVRVLVPRSDLGDLVPEFNNETTLYGRTLTLVVEAEGDRATRTWGEKVYDPEENAAREQIQQRVWRFGHKTATDADVRAQATSDILRRHEEGPSG